MKKTLIVVLCSLMLLFSCKNALQVKNTLFQGFVLPKNDSATGKSVFVPDLLFNEQVTGLEKVDDATLFLRLSGTTEAKKTLNARMRLKELVNSEYGNVQVTVTYTPLNATGKGLVSGIKFGESDRVVFLANNRSTASDTSVSDVQIVLDTTAQNQLGMILFTFKYAKSVYDSSKCVNEYQVFISTGEPAADPVIFSRIKKREGNSKLAITNNINKTKLVFTDLDRTELAKTLNIPLTMELLRVPETVDLQMRIEGGNAISISDTTFTKNGKKVQVDFNLSMPSGTYDLAGITDSCTLVIESADGLQEGLPLSVQLNTVRQPAIGTVKVSSKEGIPPEGTITEKDGLYSFIYKDVKFSATLKGIKVIVPLSFTDIADLTDSSIRLESSATGSITLLNNDPVILSNQNNSINLEFTIPEISDIKIPVTGSIILSLTDYNPMIYDVENCPKEITLNVTRDRLDEPDLKSFSTTNVNPWRWRMQYCVKDTPNKLSTEFSEGSQNSYTSLSSKYSVNGVSVTEVLTSVNTEKQAVFADSNKEKKNDGKQGDVLSSAGWLYSGLITVGGGFEYKLTASINTGNVSNSDSVEGSRVRIYLVPLENLKNDFNLADTDGTVITVAKHTETFAKATTANGITYFEVPAIAGKYELETVFSAADLARMRIVVEKGAPDWDSIDNSKMAAMEVAVSNVKLQYN